MVYLVISFIVCGIALEKGWQERPNNTYPFYAVFLASLFWPIILQIYVGQILYRLVVDILNP